MKSLNLLLPLNWQIELKITIEKLWTPATHKAEAQQAKVVRNRSNRPLETTRKLGQCFQWQSTENVREEMIVSSYTTPREKEKVAPVPHPVEKGGKGKEN